MFQVVEIQFLVDLMNLKEDYSSSQEMKVMMMVWYRKVPDVLSLVILEEKVI